ncbi:crystallin, alpha B, b isoform X1 [Osmerus eperlanus]|uniref:crystallin, alpha B, b isoform X1 n=1 Tax=Osmerus eperlanus TaxID=29151 RepID=UPI002E0E6FBE
MDVPIQYPWYRRAFSHRMPDLYSGEALPDLALGWPFTWPLPWMRTSFPRWLNWADGGHAEMRAEKDRYMINLDVKHFSPEEINVNINGDFIRIHARHEERQQDDHGFVTREFVRKYKLPGGVGSGDVTSSLSCDGVLTIYAPRGFAGQERTIPITYEDGAAPQKK